MYTAIYKKSGKYYSAWLKEVPGVNTQARTKKQAEANLKEALEMVLAAREKYFKKELGKAKVERAPLVLV